MDYRGVKVNEFERIINRENTNSMKWDKLKANYKREDLIPMWVADMDFAISPDITLAIQERIAHPILGYTFCSNDYYDAVINWIKRRHDWDIEKEWIVFTPGVVPAISYLIRALTDIGDNIIIQTPVYHLFSSTIKNNKRNVITNPLVFKNGKYYMDLEDLEKKLIQEQNC